MIAPTDDNPNGCVRDMRNLGAPLQMLHSGWPHILAFRYLLTPILLPLLFWVGSLLCLVGGVTIIASLEAGWPMFASPAFWGALALIVLGPVLLRVVGEAIDVLFRIHDHLVLLAMRRM